MKLTTAGSADYLIAQGRNLLPALCVHLSITYQRSAWLPRLPQRFWSKVEIRDTDQCWHWTAARTPDGYGSFGIRRLQHTTIPAHRLAWLLVHGPIAENLFVCHACDVPSCCNPSHLFLGTVRDNALDASKKGLLAHGETLAAAVRVAVQRGEDHWSHRNPALVMRGEDHPSAKLSVSQVRAIRHLYSAGVSQSKLAAKFNIGQTTVSEITRGLIWRHV